MYQFLDGSHFDSPVMSGWPSGLRRQTQDSVFHFDSPGAHPNLGQKIWESGLLVMLRERQNGLGGAQVVVADCMGVGWRVGAESGGQGKKKRWANVWEQESDIWWASILHLSLLNVIFTTTLEISIIISNFLRRKPRLREA